MALVEYKTRLGRERRGVCSEFLCNLQPGDVVPCRVRRGSFPAPPPSAPLILIGPGTGVAPMRAFLQERYGRFGEPAATVPVSLQLPGSMSAAQPANALTAPPPPPRGPTMMFFGCRSATDDFLYSSEWAALDSADGDGVDDSTGACRVFTAFSRIGPPHSARCYVTHLLREHGAAVWRLLQQVDCRSTIAVDFNDVAEYCSGVCGRLSCHQDASRREEVSR